LEPAISKIINNFNDEPEMNLIFCKKLSHPKIFK